MPSKVLDFVPRQQYDELRWTRMTESVQESAASPAGDLPPLTAGEIYSILYGETAESMRRLIQFYKHSGKWTKEAESQMTKIVKELQTVCETIAHASVRTK